MAKNVGTVDTSQFSNLRSVLAQGADVGDTGQDYNGTPVKWTGVVWEPLGGSGGNGGSGSYPTFNFDWTKAREDALAQLTPYYEQKLKEAGGDVERAKRLIEEDYKMGLRYANEDYTKTDAEANQDYLVSEKYRLESLKTEEERAGTLTTEKQLEYDIAIRQANEDLATNMKELGLDITDENRNLQGKLNNQGVLLGTITPGSNTAAAPVSNYADVWHLGPQAERQDLRKLAIERAIERQTEAAGMTKKSALGDIDYGLERTQTASAKAGELSDIEKQRAITNALQEKTRTSEGLGVSRVRGIEEQDISYPRTQRDIEEEKREKAFNQVTPMKYNEEYSKYRAVNNLG